MKEQTITISVRILKKDVALARDRLKKLDMVNDQHTMSDIIRNTFYAGLTIMSNFTNKSVKDQPSQDSINFLNNIKGKKSNKVDFNTIMDKLSKGDMSSND